MIEPATVLITAPRKVPDATEHTFLWAKKAIRVVNNRNKVVSIPLNVSKKISGIENGIKIATIAATFMLSWVTVNVSNLYR